MKRRSFLKAAGGGILAGSFGGASTAADENPAPDVRSNGTGSHGSPNILWIQTDEHRTDSLGCYGSQWAKTPNIDALAERGVTMTNCVCQSPVCVPSRSSQLTCVYPQECNVLFNNEVAWVPDVFPAETVTFPEVFADAGYHTVNIGKSHTPVHPTWQDSREGNGGFDKKYADFCSLGPGYDEAKYRVVKRPGIHQIIIGGTYPTFLDNPTMKLTDSAIEYLRTRDQSKPFLLRVSYNWPHTPVLPPPPFDRLYHKGEVPVQARDAAAIQSRAKYDQTLAAAQRMAELTEAQYSQEWHDYMGLVGYVDYEVGRLMAAIKALGLDQNTIVVLTSDHGRALGEFGHGEKCTFDRQVWGVPCIWYWPGQLPKGEARADLCELVDTGRTLLGLTGLADKAPAHWRGRDLFGSSPPKPEGHAVYGQIGWPNRNAPLIKNERVSRQYEALTEVMGMTPEQAYPIFGYMRLAIRTQRYRMDVNWMQDGRRIKLAQADGNLFDIEKDPLEKQNLWAKADSRQTIKALNDKLCHWFNGLSKPAGVFGA